MDDYTVLQSSEGASVIFDLCADMKYSVQIFFTNADGRFKTTPINFSNVVHRRVDFKSLSFQQPHMMSREPELLPLVVMRSL